MKIKLNSYFNLTILILLSFMISSCTLGETGSQYREATEKEFELYAHAVLTSNLTICKELDQNVEWRSSEEENYLVPFPIRNKCFLEIIKKIKNSDLCEEFTYTGDATKSEFTSANGTVIKTTLGDFEDYKKRCVEETDQFDNCGRIPRNEMKENFEQYNPKQWLKQDIEYTGAEYEMVPGRKTYSRGGPNIGGHYYSQEKLVKIVGYTLYGVDSNFNNLFDYLIYEMDFEFSEEVPIHMITDIDPGFGKHVETYTDVVYTTASEGVNTFVFVVDTCHDLTLGKGGDYTLTSRVYKTEGSEESIFQLYNFAPFEGLEALDLVQE